MKKTLVTLSFILFSYTGFSQDIKIDKNIISVDGKECLKIGDDSDSNNVSIQDLEGNDIVFLKFIHNSKYGPLYNKITFLNQKLSFTSKSFIFTKKSLIKKLVSDKTLIECKLDDSKVEKFVLKYDENVESN